MPWRWHRREPYVVKATVRWGRWPLPMGAAIATEPTTHYSAVPMTGMAGREPLPFPLYLQTGASTFVLYREVNAHVGEDHLQRLLSEGVSCLFIRGSDRDVYLHRIEKALDQILADRAVPIERRADVLHGVAITVAREVLERPPDSHGIERAQRLLVNAGVLVLREQKAFSALRSLLGASKSLAQHGVTAGFLAMGLARHVLSAGPNIMVMAGLAGLLHDVGMIGHEDIEHDPEHCQRGHDHLKRIGMPAAVCEAALYHHERWDGSGFPQALSGNQIPELARVVGLVDVFDKVYSSQQPRVGVFDALRIMAQAYKGCFEEHYATQFIKLFR